MSHDIDVITPALLRGWPLPEPGGSKYGRGQVVVVGGAPRSPGAAMLGGLAALRVGAGRLTLAVGASVAPTVAVAVPESGIVPLPETAGGAVRGTGVEDAATDLEGADAVLVGPGLDDAEEALDLVRMLPGLLSDQTIVVLDAYALGVACEIDDLPDRLGGRLVMTPNSSEIERLLERDASELEDDVLAIASRYGAVVSSKNLIASPDGRLWRSGTGDVGLGTSGSGDVLAGAITGLAARGASVDQAAVWATHLHGASGDRLAARVGPLGYLATELVAELPLALVEVG